MTTSHLRPRWAFPVGLICIAFGLITIAVGGKTLSEGLAAGLPRNVVPFVLGFNFVAGFAYVAAGFGLMRARRWTFVLSAAIASATALVFIAFGAHIVFGGEFQTKTVAAMTVRTLFWIAIAIGSYRVLLGGRSGAQPVESAQANR
jgi:hypothetical protein